ncbi:type IV pilus modification protein PilV [Acinetobacter indicus]|uniref:type IV pilus modification protein PilV n=1 Tax=Acinetobacter indicus TaxID=756892 RepID=UPI001443D46C|nr:type IV pilus modification protein PilV [Acinetobacter indicus]
MNYQKGVGLTEVIVAMFLLGGAVLGYAFLQFKSLEMSEQALKKVEAMNIARNLGERMFVNKDIKYQDITISSANQNNCIFVDTTLNTCSSQNLAAKDLADINRITSNKGMSFDIHPCPGTQNGRQCIYVAWDETQPIPEDDDEADNACTESDVFRYKANAHCVVVEAF